MPVTRPNADSRRDATVRAALSVGAALLAAGGIAAYATRQHTTANQDQGS
jgi:hypothetical protein